MFSRVKPTTAEVAAELPGDNIIASADVVMDRAFTLPAAPDIVWPWILQLGKNRAGWYFPRSIEYFILPSKRALRTIESQYLHLKVGSVIDDWGGRNATFTVALIETNKTLVYTSTRGKVSMSWAICLRLVDNHTRIQFRLRLTHIKMPWLARTAGGLMDLLTIAGLAAGLRQRLGSK